jgi:ABC-type transport system substrate-binding protein
MAFGNFRFEPDGDDWPYWLHSKQAKARTGIDDPELDRLIDQQARELDEAKRKQMWIDIQRQLLEKHYVIPTITQVGFIAYQPYVFGWGDNRAGQAVNQSWEETWMRVEDAPSGR